MLRIQEKIKRQDDGAVAVMVGVFLLTLIVFAAWAVDISAVLVERRADQNVADVSALSGIQMTTGLTQAAAISAAEAEVRRLATINHNIANGGWSTCTDPDRPVEFSIPSSNPCVWFTLGLAEIRVRVPDQDVDTLFAGVIGINSIATRAEAEAGYYSADGNGLIPFGLPPSASGEVCLKVGTQDLSPPCDNANTNGNFGFLDFKLYQSANNAACSTGWLVQNIAEGVDHFLSIKTLNNTLISETSVCGNIAGRPNATLSQTGNTNELHAGLVDGSNPTARLKRSSTTTTVFGNDIDDRPLWTYLIGGSGICAESFIEAQLVPHEAMGDCLYSPNPPGNPVFSASLTSSPRWAWVPRIDQEFTNGNVLYAFTDFEPSFIQTVYYQCTGGVCPEFNPGEVGTYNGNKKAHAASAFLIPASFITSDFPLGPGDEETIEITLNK